LNVVFFEELHLLLIVVFFEEQHLLLNVVFFEEQLLQNTSSIGFAVSATLNIPSMRSICN